MRPQDENGPVSGTVLDQNRSPLAARPELGQDRVDQDHRAATVDHAVAYDHRAVMVPITAPPVTAAISCALRVRMSVVWVIVLSIRFGLSGPPSAVFHDVVI
jgi:hypothetical protein